MLNSSLFLSRLVSWTSIRSLWACVTQSSLNKDSKKFGLGSIELINWNEPLSSLANSSPVKIRCSSSVTTTLSANIQIDATTNYFGCSIKLAKVNRHSKKAHPRLSGRDHKKKIINQITKPPEFTMKLNMCLWSVSTNAAMNILHRCLDFSLEGSMFVRSSRFCSWKMTTRICWSASRIVQTLELPWRADFQPVRCRHPDIRSASG